MTMWGEVKEAHKTKTHNGFLALTQLYLNHACRTKGFLANR
jgi:hypothetical protein